MKKYITAAIFLAVIASMNIGCNKDNPSTTTDKGNPSTSKDIITIPSEFIPDNEWRKKVSDLDTERCVNDIISTTFDYNMLNIASNNLVNEAFAISFVTNAKLAIKTILDTKKDADLTLIATVFVKVAQDSEEVIYNQSKGKYRCNAENIAKYQIKEYNGNDKSLPNVFKQFVNQYAKSEFGQLDTNGIELLSSLSYIFMLNTAYDNFIKKSGYNTVSDQATNNSVNNPVVPDNQNIESNAKDINEEAQIHLAATNDNVEKANNFVPVKPSQNQPTTPTTTQNNNESYKEKRCDTQTISNEKHLPKWNIEIIDSSVIASMLKDAEKNHLPFLKINASDNLKQKLEDYINKNPSKLHKDSQNAFTCEPGNYIKTASNIGIQLVSCNDNKMSVVFLNLVSPVDNKARVYTAKTFDHLFEDAPVITKTEETVINGERGAYVAVKYEIYYDGTGHERIETDIVHYLFLGDKLRFLSDWNAFHIEEDWHYEEDGTEDYSCDAKTTVLRLENSEVKHIYSTPNSTRPDSWPNQFHDNVPAVHTNHRERHQIMPVYNAEECKFYKDAKLTPDAKTAPKNLSRFLKSFNPSFYEYAIQRFIENPITVTRTAKTCTLTLDGECYYYEQFFLDSDCSVSISEKNAFITVSDAQKYQLNKGDVFPTCLLDSKKSNKSGTECQGKFKSNSYWQVLEDTPRTIYQWSQGTDIEECNEVTDKVIFVYDQEGIETRRALYNEIELGMQNLNQLCQ